MPLGFVRYYNGLLWTGIYAIGTTQGLISALGPNWRSSYDRLILFSNSVTYPTAYVYRPDGRTLHFKLYNGTFAFAQFFEVARVDPQLLYCSGAEGVAGCDEDFIAVLEEEEGYFG